MSGQVIANATGFDRMFEMISACIPGVMELRSRIHEDLRGRFVKVFHQGAFHSMGVRAECAETFYSVSRRHVIRGLHFQIPPAAHSKLVYCVQGKIQDAVVDLRLGSPTYGQCTLTELSADAGNVLYVPQGIAHGFCTLSETAIVVYHVSGVYSPEHDCGVRWDSADIPWAVDCPIMSDRDSSFPTLAAFVSPFRYGVNE